MQLQSAVYLIFNLRYATMAAPEHSETYEQSSCASQNGDKSNSSSLRKNGNRHGLNPRASPFTPQALTNSSPAYQSQGNGYQTNQLAIPSAIGDLRPYKNEKCASHASVPDNSYLTSSARNTSRKEYPARQPTIPPTIEDLERDPKINFAWKLQHDKS